MDTLKIDILTLFPKMFSGPFQESLVGKAQSKGLVQIQIHDLRNFTVDKHRKVDDKPFGGGRGMLLKVEPIFNALKQLSVEPSPAAKPKKRLGKDGISKKQAREERPFVIHLSPQGKTLNHSLARQLSTKKHLILICGRYEGIDERAMRWVDAEISIGDYVLTGGELPAMVLVDAVARLVPGVVKEWESVQKDSFFDPLLDCSQYTRPANFLGMKVPQILLSGNHREIERWRKENSLLNTFKKRPDLLEINT